MIMYSTARLIIDKFGSPTVIAASLAFTTLRFTAYYFIKYFKKTVQVAIYYANA